MLPEERVRVASGCPEIYNLTTLPRVQQLLKPNSMITFNRYFDLALVSPMMMITQKIDQFQHGDLLIPIKFYCEENKILGLCPLKAADQDDRTVPLDRIIELEPEILKTTYEENNPVCTKAGDNDIVIRPGSSIASGDYIVVRGQYYKVSSIGFDDPRTLKEGVMHKVYIEGKFKNTVNGARLHYKKIPKIHGYFRLFDRSMLQPHHPVTLS